MGDKLEYYEEPYSTLLLQNIFAAQISISSIHWNSHLLQDRLQWVRWLLAWKMRDGAGCFAAWRRALLLPFVRSSLKWGIVLRLAFSRSCRWGNWTCLQWGTCCEQPCWWSSRGRIHSCSYTLRCRINQTLQKCLVFDARSDGYLIIITDKTFVRSVKIHTLDVAFDCIELSALTTAVSRVFPARILETKVVNGTRSNFRILLDIWSERVAFSAIDTFRNGHATQVLCQEVHKLSRY